MKLEFFHIVAVPIFLLGVFGIFSCGGEEQAVKTLPLKAFIVFPEENRSIRAGETIYFEGDARGGTPPYAYRWNFGVGIAPSTKEVPGNVTFSFEGSYNIELTVTDRDNRTASARVIIDVAPSDLTSG